MNKITFFTLFSIFSFSLYAQQQVDNTWKNQVNTIFQGLDKNRIPHEVLLDYAMEFTNVSAYPVSDK